MEYMPISGFTLRIDCCSEKRPISSTFSNSLYRK